MTIEIDLNDDHERALGLRAREESSTTTLVEDSSLITGSLEKQDSIEEAPRNMSIQYQEQVIQNS